MEHLKKDETPKVKKKRRWPIILLIILIVITLILGGSALAIYLSIGDMTPEQTPTIAAVPSSAVSYSTRSPTTTGLVEGLTATETDPFFSLEQWTVHLDTPQAAK